MPTFPRPLAIGLTASANPADEAHRSARRITLALRAAREGYSLIETFELSRDSPLQEATLHAAEELAVRLDAQALIVSGCLDTERVLNLARRARLMVIEVP